MLAFTEEQRTAVKMVATSLQMHEDSISLVDAGLILEAIDAMKCSLGDGEPREALPYRSKYVGKYRSAIQAFVERNLWQLSQIHGAALCEGATTPVSDSRIAAMALVAIDDYVRG